MNKKKCRWLLLSWAGGSLRILYMIDLKPYCFTENIEEWQAFQAQNLENAWTRLGLSGDVALWQQCQYCVQQMGAWRMWGDWLFNKMPSCDVVTWNAIILGRAKYRQGQKASEQFQLLQHECVQPNLLLFVGLQKCMWKVSLHVAVHQQIIWKWMGLRCCGGNS